MARLDEEDLDVHRVWGDSGDFLVISRDSKLKLSSVPSNSVYVSRALRTQIYLALSPTLRF
jgi:hypothetical protein